MRPTLLAFLLFLAPAACTPLGVGDARLVTACQNGDTPACAPRPLHEQARLDASAIMMGMQVSAVHEAATQGRGP